MTKPDDTTPLAVGSPVDRGVRPVAEVVCGRLRWHIPTPTYSAALKFMNNDTHPLYDQDALDAAVAAERERWIAACNTVSDGAERARRPGVQTVAQVRKLAIDGPNVRGNRETTHDQD